jgi:predicted nucleic acid-binding Zn ribbon protein
MAYDDDRAEPVGDVLKRWMRRSGILRTSERDRLWDAWQRLLGRDAPHTVLSGLKNHVLVFDVDSSALLAELNNFRKQDLLEGLRAEVKSYFVRDIRFRLQKDVRRPR